MFIASCIGCQEEPSPYEQPMQSCSLDPFVSSNLSNHRTHQNGNPYVGIGHNIQPVASVSSS